MPSDTTNMRSMSKFTETESNGGCQGSWRDGELVLKGDRASVLQDERLLELDVLVIAQQCEYS